MKKIFTLLFSSALLTTAAFAQYGQRDKHADVIIVNSNNGYDKNHDRDGRDYDRDGRNYDRDGKGYSRGAFIFTARERDMQLNQINREYSYKIQSVKNRYGMSWYQKKRIIYNLDEQRDQEIAMVWAKFNHKKNKFGDNGRRNGDRW